MKEKHFTEKELIDNKLDPMTFMISTLIDLGAPIKLKNILQTPIREGDFEIVGNLEEHRTHSGEITFLWDEGDWFE